MELLSYSLIKFNLKNEYSPLMLLIIDKKIMKELLFGHFSCNLSGFKYVYILEMLNS